jgi:hypothetical protein
MRSISLVTFVFLAGCGNPSMMMNQPDMSMQSGQCMHTVTCTDQSVQQLALFRPVNAANIGNVAASDGFTTTVDATAGGLSPSRSFVYAKFTAQGLERVGVGDEDAFNSMDWDIAFRRYVIRLNSGISGPSCVIAARTATGTSFDSVTSVPSGLDFRTEEYFTATCDFVPDGSGLGGPGTALQSFWEYPNCVKMTKNVFVIKLADGRHVKLRVDAYYNSTEQLRCDTVGGMPSANSGAANYTLRWAFLP